MLIGIHQSHCQEDKTVFRGISCTHRNMYNHYMRDGIVKYKNGNLT